MSPLRSLRRTALVGVVWVGGAASASEPVEVLDAASAEPPRNYGNLRVGASTSSLRPTLCLELSPLEMLSLEGCGTGSGFLHHDKAPEIAHFRSWLKLTSWKLGGVWLQPRMGVGFAELQVGEDGGGFHFAGVGATGVETAGPEVGASLRLLLPAVAGMEWVGEVGVSGAYFHYAPLLNLPQSSFQPSASLSLGVGF
ncbi:hypothetical protein [Archangium primigenium]|uniref:hypothetical protein n=1 Tax=[Archangium] primigenium TaxID=2792470 RepID=UPI001EF97DF0|nr:hypothetical protein [Archangium primigenium]MBM7113859.1 hypothetical protein [Archangium primigenium]